MGFDEPGLMFDIAADGYVDQGESVITVDLFMDGFEPQRIRVANRSRGGGGDETQRSDEEHPALVHLRLEHAIDLVSQGWRDRLLQEWSQS